MLKVEMVTPRGTVWDLTGVAETSPVLAPEGQLAGLTGNASRTDLSIPGRAGVLPGDTRYGAIEADVQFFLRTFTGEEMERVHAAFRKAWSVYSRVRPTPPVVLKINSDSPHSPLAMRLWLSKPLPGVDVDSRKRTSLDITVPVLIPSGVATGVEQTGRGTVEVANTGDVTIYPRIAYTGRGGQVTCPSGAVFVLPAVGVETVVSMDPLDLRLEGAFPEGVEPGDAGRWVLPEGAELRWAVGVVDPWT